MYLLTITFVVVKHNIKLKRNCFTINVTNTLLVFDVLSYNSICCPWCPWCVLVYSMNSEARLKRTQHTACKTRNNIHCEDCRKVRTVITFLLCNPYIVSSWNYKAFYVRDPLQNTLTNDRWVSMKFIYCLRWSF